MSSGGRNRSSVSNTKSSSKTTEQQNNTYNNAITTSDKVSGKAAAPTPEQVRLAQITETTHNTQPDPELLANIEKVGRK